MSLVALARRKLADLETARETAMKHARPFPRREPCFIVSPPGPETVKQPWPSADVRAPGPCFTPDRETADETRLKQALPADWRDGLARLATMDPPPLWPGWRDWRLTVADALALGEAWGATAHALGWDTLTLWGCNPDPSARRLDRDGVAMLMQGRPVVAMTERTASILRPGGHRLAWYRQPFPGMTCPAPGALPLWALG